MAQTFAHSHAVPTPVRFTKQQLLEELAWFMPALSRSVDRLFGSHSATAADCSNVRQCDADLAQLQDSYFWRSIVELYDYGVSGVMPSIADLGDGSLLDAELFLDGIHALREFLQEDDGGTPKLCKATMALALARQALDAASANDVITTTEFARLARLDEKVVVAMIAVEAGHPMTVGVARCCLNTLTDFVPTGAQHAAPVCFSPAVPIELPIDVIRAINERAGLAGVTPFEVLRAAFKDETARDHTVAISVICGQAGAVSRHVPPVAEAVEGAQQ